MIEYKYADLYEQDSIDKQLIIQTDDKLVTITNTELHSEQFQLTESLCSKSELRFGCCEASSIKFRISNVFIPLKDMWLTVTETLGGNTDVSFQFGRYKVFSDKPTADRRYRDIVAYDAMYDIIKSDVADWYNTILPDKTSTVTLKQFRSSFVSHFGLDQEEINLANDDMIVEKTIEPSEISGKDVVTAICEINGCFGHIGRDGKFRYILLPKYIEGLYPANDLFPADDLYPRDPRTTKIGNGLYINCKYEDFVTHKIDKLQIRQEENDIGAPVGTGTNCYIVENNFLVYGKSAADLEHIANNLFGIITEISYRPFKADVKGNPCFEVGDAVRLTTKYEIVESYILNRTLKGIQALRDVYSTDGVEEYSKKVNSVNRSIIQLKGKTNELERTVEETKSTISDVEKGLQSQIKQTSESIAAEVKRAQGQEVELAAAIQITAESVSAKVSKGDVISQINLEAGNATIAAEKINLNGAVSANGSFRVLENGDVEITGGTIFIDTKDADGQLIRISSTANGRKLSAGMGAYGFAVDYGGEGSHLMWHGLEIPGGGYLDYKDGKSMVGALEAYLGTVLIDMLTASTAHIGSLTADSSTITTSDRNAKHDIEQLDRETAAAFIYDLKPCRFKYDDGTSGRYHHGLIAQELKEAMVDDWGVYIDGAYRTDGEQDETDGVDGEQESEQRQGIRYEELIADLIATIQSQDERIKKLEQMEEKRWSKRIKGFIGRIIRVMRHL